MTRLRRDLSLVTTMGLPQWSAGPTGDDDPITAAAEAGYEGVQVFFPEQAARARAVGLVASAISPARGADDIDAVAAMWAAGEPESLTLHLGTGFETASEATSLVAAARAAEERHGVRMLIETHRATLFQDPARALTLVEEFPDIRFTGDLSHWYTGVEMVYGDYAAKVEALQPVLARCRMIHGRISDPGCIQVEVADDDLGDDGPEYVKHFADLWTSIAAANAVADDAPAELPFVVELLPARAYYARTIIRDGEREEEVDRWEQADVLWRLAVAAAEPVLQTAPAPV